MRVVVDVKKDSAQQRKRVVTGCKEHPHAWGFERAWFTLHIELSEDSYPSADNGVC